MFLQTMAWIGLIPKGGFKETKTVKLVLITE